MRTAIGIAVPLAALLLAACSGGGGGGAVGSAGPGGLLVGTFVDSPVSGIEYESASSSGTTDANGNFSYRQGETVRFHVGGANLGAVVPAGPQVTPLDLVPGAASSGDVRVVRLLRFLQSLDSNGNLNDGIQISASVRATLNAQPSLDVQSASDSEVSSLIGGYKVSASAAIAHFESYRNGGAGSESDDSSASTSAASSSTGEQDEASGESEAGASGASAGGGAAGGGTAAGPAAQGGYVLIAWNDLGMHCFDGKDFSVFSILPPYNNLHAQLVDRSGAGLVSAGVTLTYESVMDTAGSINTSSAGKTNFWDYVLVLFGANPAPNYGLNLTSGGPSNPAPSLVPAQMTYNNAQGWWEAEGIPVTPYDDSGNKNFYPMVKVVAQQGGTVLASTKVVLPTSDEMSCIACHASNSSSAAKPAAGWVGDSDPQKDWKKNILRLHDEKFPAAIAAAGMTAAYQAYGTTLLAAAQNGKPSLCASCHQSNALATPGISGIKPLTEAIHATHASVADPATGVALDAVPNREACYACHPGSKTKCLRGVMGNATDANGNALIDCQSCHGGMSVVGASGREGWLQEPNCQSCHDKTSPTGAYTRFTSVFVSGTQLRTVQDTSGRFAANPNTPAGGISLYRFSTGHGDLQCEACHGATHAVYPSSHANDNVQSMDLQGHIGTIAECAVCHASVPMTSSGGPHGMHTVGQVWLGEGAHGGAARTNRAACAECHGSDYRGGILSRTSAARSFNIEGRSRTYAAGDTVGCYDCHNGPNGGD